MYLRSRVNYRSIVLGLLVIGAAFIFSNAAFAAELYLHSGAGLRQPVDELTAEFTKETGIKVRIEYAGSGKSLARIKATGQGDVFLPGSHFYIDKLKAEGQVLWSHPVVLHIPVIGVWKKTTKQIEKFADLGKPGVRVGLGDPKAMALGRTAEDILRNSGIADKILPNVIVRAATVKQLSLYVQKGEVDAAIISRADAFQANKTVRMIPIDKSWYKPEIITAAVLKTSSDPKLARKLAEFLSSPRAVEVFGKFGFLPLSAR